MFMQIWIEMKILALVALHIIQFMLYYVIFMHDQVLLS